MTELEEYMNLCTKNIEKLNQCINIHTKVLNRHNNAIVLLSLTIILMGIGMFLK